MPVEDTGNQRGTARALSGDFSPGAPEEHLRRPLSRCRGRRCSALTHVTMVAGPDTPSARDVTVLARSSRIVTGCRLFVRLSSNQWIGATTLWNGPIPIPALDVLSATGLLLAGI